MNTHDLVDIWREKNPLVKNFTWSSNITPGIHCRLDYFLISRHIDHSVEDVAFSPGLQSDHSFISFSFHTHSVKRGPGFWKINNSLMNDPNYVEIINDLILKELDNNVSINPSVRWELLKYKIRAATVKYSKLLAKQKRAKENELVNRIAELEQMLYVNESPNTRSLLKEAQNDLLLHYNYKLQGTIIRSRARWVEEGEKNTKYFLNLEKRNKSLNSIHALKNAEGDLISSNDEILLQIKNFYQGLYKSSDCVPDPFFYWSPNF